MIVTEKVLIHNVISVLRPSMKNFEGKNRFHQPKLIQMLYIDVNEWSLLIFGHVIAKPSGSTLLSGNCRLKRGERKQHVEPRKAFPDALSTVFISRCLYRHTSMQPFYIFAWPCHTLNYIQTILCAWLNIWIIEHCMWVPIASHWNLVKRLLPSVLTYSIQMNRWLFLPSNTENLAIRFPPSYFAQYIFICNQKLMLI